MKDIYFLKLVDYNFYPGIKMKTCQLVSKTSFKSIY